MKNSRKLANLRPIQKGEVRNPKGKPKGTKNFATIARKWLESPAETIHPITKKRAHLTQLDVIILEQIKKARRGDTRAFEALLDRMDGKPSSQKEIVYVQASPNKNHVRQVAYLNMRCESCPLSKKSTKLTENQIICSDSI